MQPPPLNAGAVAVVHPAKAAQRHDAVQRLAVGIQVRAQHERQSCSQHGEHENSQGKAGKPLGARARDPRVGPHHERVSELHEPKPLKGRLAHGGVHRKHQLADRCKGLGNVFKVLRPADQFCPLGAMDQLFTLGPAHRAQERDAGQFLRPVFKQDGRAVRPINEQRLRLFLVQDYVHVRKQFRQLARVQRLVPFMVDDVKRLRGRGQPQSVLFCGVRRFDEPRRLGPADNVLHQCVHDQQKGRCGCVTMALHPPPIRDMHERFSVCIEE